MFANRARSQRFNYGLRRNPAVGRPSNDNQRQLRTFAAPRRMRRPVLGCHWLVGPSGALECAWHVEATEKSLTDEPISSWRLRPTPALASYGVVGKQAAQLAVA
jgi:hypothetical protein